ncbi:MAG: ABC transporter ATP-binding protein [Deltaproteobacteria bacterium]|nr:ABC transporter ATP-binding protein [Deltaproteobacteria bacterium]
MVTAAKNLNVSFQRGVLTSIIGPNGAGKTTTFRSIMGLTPAKTGIVRFKGRDCTKLPPYKRARLGLGFVPEDRRILGPFTVKENLGLGRIPGRTGRWTLESVLEQFPVLSHMLDRLGGTLSGGEQQMLTIARALMSNPDVLVLDEPTEGLAPVVVSVLKDLMMSLKKADATILLSEQNIRFAMGVSDGVVVIDKGHVVFRGPMEDFKKEESIQKKYLAV